MRFRGPQALNDTYEKQAVRGGALLLTRHPMKSVCPACPELLGERPSGGVRRFRPGRKGPLFTRRHKPRDPRLLVHRHGLRGARRIATLFISATRRGQSWSVIAMNFNPSPPPGITCCTTASTLICPSGTRKSSLTLAPMRRGPVVERNNPPTLRSQMRETSSSPSHRQQAHTSSCVSTREICLLE